MAPTGALVHALEEAQGATLDVGAVVTSHDGLNGLSGLICVVKWNRADVVVEHVSLNNAMEKLATDKSEFAINRRSGATNVVPRCTGVMRKGWICVLEVGDRN